MPPESRYKIVYFYIILYNIERKRRNTCKKHKKLIYITYILKMGGYTEMYRAGIDLGGTNIKAGIVDEDQKIIAQASAPTGAERSAEEVLSLIHI